MNLINMDRTQGELTKLTLRTIKLRGSLQTSDTKVNLLIRLTTIENFNTSVCHHQKWRDCWNKMCLALSPLSFAENKVLKMSIVQVCKTIYKKLNVFISSIGSGRTNESNEIYKKEACVAR
jgi:hypothetical protein